MQIMKLQYKLRCCFLALTMTLVTTCAMGGDRVKLRREAVEAMANLNEAEEHWTAQYRRYSPAESGSAIRETTRIRTPEEMEKSERRNSGSRPERRSGDNLGTNYKSL
jgi:hypothetical protein